MTDVPTMDEVLREAPKNWGKWGEEDQVGALNYLTTEEVFRGVRHIKSGTVFTLQRLIGDPNGDPVWPGRTPAEKTMILDESSWDGDGAPQFPGGLHYADDKISAFLQGSTQYDALGHVWYGGQLWNGYDARSTVGGLDGVALTEICDLEKLASHSAEDRQYTFLYTAAPLKVNEASGSPVNPLVIK
ncbi:MAG: hypothetical protein ACLQGN_24660 [Mycobacterium sp.]|uniref:hypothetical protein n=1 Tax=Mycobacterium sp. TaxID=1785 RepID=UPI003F9DF605